MGLPMPTPSTLNVTSETAMLSDAVADMVTDEPETVDPVDGDSMEADGGVVSGGSAKTVVEQVTTVPSFETVTVKVVVVPSDTI
jgi:hypothetical protein